jgi:hypothetical protein
LVKDSHGSDVAEKVFAGGKINVNCQLSGNKIGEHSLLKPKLHLRGLQLLLSLNMFKDGKEMEQVRNFIAIIEAHATKGLGSMLHRKLQQ